MNNKLKPWHELLVGVVLLGVALVTQKSTSVVVGDPIFILSNIIILIAVVHAIIRGVKKIGRKGGVVDIKATTKDTANTILTSFLAIKEKHDYPVETSSDKLNVYAHVLSLRPGYTDDVIKRVLKEAHKLSVLKGEDKGISLNTLVFSIVVYEYTVDTRKNLTDSQMMEIDTTIGELFG